MSGAAPVTEGHGLGRRFGPAWAVRGLDFEVPPGALVGLVGPDGAGKTTLLQLMAAILDPSEGSCRVLGFDTVREAAQVTARIGYMARGFTLYPRLTVAENLAFFASAYGLGRGRAGAGVTVLVTTHYLEEAAYCNRLGLMHEGRLIAVGDLEALRARFPERRLASVEDVFLAFIERERAAARPARAAS